MTAGPTGGRLTDTDFNGSTLDMILNERCHEKMREDAKLSHAHLAVSTLGNKVCCL